MAANQVQSLKRAIALLKAIDDARRPLTLHELAERTELVKSTVHRLLATLREEDLVEQLPDGRYSLGLHLFEMGCSAGYMRDIVFIARPYMQAVWKQTNESVSLALLSHGGGDRALAHRIHQRLPRWWRAPAPACRRTAPCRARSCSRT